MNVSAIQFRILLPVFCAFALTAANAQEVLSPLKNNPNIHISPNAGNRSIVENRDTLCLPFFDDFSSTYLFIDGAFTDCGDTIIQQASDIYPASVYWMDSAAFVNRTYPTLPPTYGVVTLDGLNKFGKPYNEASSFSPADELTSKPLYLGDGIIDSVYLSFYYQPGGLGEYPNENDSLILDFKSADGNWNMVWSAVNLNGDDPQSFKLEMIPVTDEYHYNGFQFRFRNWAGVNGNNDHWHLDYILLDDDRTFNDTLFRDVAIIYQPEHYLRHYRQMPWNQFKDHQAEELTTDHGVFMYNNYNTIINTAHQYEVTEKYSGATVVAETAPVSINLDPFTIAYNTYPSFTVPAATPGYDEDSLTLRFRYSIEPSGDINSRNDSLYYDQAFYNYFAYDDGSAEAAYALYGTGAKLAIRYHANEPDTIKEVYIHWAYVDGAKSNLFFSLTLWDMIDTTGASSDENIIFQNDFLTPKYVDSINGFYVYKLVDFLGNPTPVVVDGDFYVGWLQSQDGFLNVGFDANNDAKEYVFFNVGSGWQRSALPGSIMIRPQLGGDYSMYNSIPESPVYQSYLLLYPNPANDVITMANISGAQDVAIYDRGGALVFHNTVYDATVDVQQLASGLYILRTIDLTTGAVRSSTFIRQ